MISRGSALTRSGSRAGVARRRCERRGWWRGVRGGRAAGRRAQLAVEVGHVRDAVEGALHGLELLLHEAHATLEQTERVVAGAPLEVPGQRLLERPEHV